MKKTLIAVACLIVMLASSAYADAAGSAFGALSTAGTAGMGHGSFGFAIGLADATSFTGTFNYGLSQHMDGRLKLGFIDPDAGDMEIALGADFKYQLVSVTGASKGPFDMAIGGFLEYYGIGDISILQLGGHYTGSYPVQLESGGTLTPYGRFSVRMESLSNGGSETNLEIGINGGVHWAITGTLGFFGEFQIDGNDGVFFGIDLSAL
ncbi:MAG: hypothetical protein JSV52_03075 [Candidatus Zixiibacteriota bacterium]|nr:MAG: hypothetical protein JSV52_03075 [candidate division Zixibacteria bacterium]